MSEHAVEAPAAPRAAAVPPRAGTVKEVRVGRQGIYDHRRQLAAYELLFRSTAPTWTPYGAGPEEEVHSEQATSQVIASTFGTFGVDAISDGRPLFINFTRAFLTGVIPLPVEPDRVVVEVVRNVAVDRELLIGLGDLKSAGYRIAVHDFGGTVDRSPLVELADFVKIDVNQVKPVLLPGLVAAVRAGGATLVARNVEDAETFTRCVELDFELFQGAYLQRPVVLERRTLTPSQVICARLLNDLGDAEAPIARIEQMVGSDPGLTLRLLRTANSAAGGARHEVTSLRQALVLIGPRRLRSWVVLTLLEGGLQSTTSDDLWRVLARAFACQKLATAQEDLAFTVGLLSGAAELLGAEAGSVAQTAGVGDETMHALVDGTGPAGKALRAVLAHEHDDTGEIPATGLAPFDVSRAYLESLSESLQIVHDLTGS